MIARCLSHGELQRNGRWRKGARAFAAWLLLGTPWVATAKPADTIVSLLVGDFDNGAQYDAVDSALKVPPSVSDDWLDRQHATQRRVEAPGIGTHVVYLEWRSGRPDGPVSRQRLWSFDAASGRMRFYAFRNPAPFAGRANEPGAFHDLTPDMLIGYPPECDVAWTPLAGPRSLPRRIGRGQVAAPHPPPPVGWRGRIAPERCRIVAQSGRAMRLDVTILLDGGGFSYQEAGILDSGAAAFRVPPTTPYEFRRISSR